MAFPQIDTPNAGPLLASELDRCIGRNYAPWPDTLQYDEPDAAEAYRAEWRQAAEACTDIDADDNAVNPQASALFWSTYLALALVAVVATLAAYWPA